MAGLVLVVASCTGDAGDTSGDRPPTYETWDEVVGAARGSALNWYLWGGSATTNENVDRDIGGPLGERFEITLNRVPINDTADAVSQVLDEAAAGVTSGGSIDLIWINGENFRTLKDADLLYGPWARDLPNATFVPWGEPTVDFDFGTAVDGYESPWGRAQLVFEYNSDLVATPPTTFEDLERWILDNPGLFTYPALPDFTGSGFVRQVFYWVAGGPEPFLEGFDQATFEEVAPKVWEYLNRIEPDLWRGGETYPQAASMEDLLANQEIAFNLNYSPGNASLKIRQGVYPESVRTFVMDTGSLANHNYLAIPFNAANPAAAMVTANFILSPEFQLVMADPDRWGWEIPTDPTRWPEEARRQLETYRRGPATLPSAELRERALPEPSAAWVTAMEEGWIENVLER